MKHHQQSNFETKIVNLKSFLYFLAELPLVVDLQPFTFRAQVCTKIYLYNLNLFDASSETDARQLQFS